MMVKYQHPLPHAKYLVKRDLFFFTATPCYGMHEPWWVVQTMRDEAPPEPMLPEDQWWTIEMARHMILERPAPTMMTRY